MTHDVEVLNAADPRWAAFLDARPEATVFHHPNWSRVLAESYGYRPALLAWTSARGVIEAGLPIIEVVRPLRGRRWIALPFTDYCPPLLGDPARTDISEQLAALARSSRLDALEVHAELPVRPGIFNYTEAVRHVLPLCPDPAQLYRRLGKGHQRNIRKAEQAGLSVSIGMSEREIEEFYALHLRTRRRLGVPIQPRRFFDLLARHILTQDLGFVATARLGEVPIASAIFLGFNGTLIYKYGASDDRYWEYRPNNVLFWSLIRWACVRGYETFDWGRSDLADEGLRRFKSGWGAEEVPLVYTTIASARPARGRRPGRLRGLMSAVIRHSPPLVCRTAGECLYRFAA